ncbi:MAG: FlgD immunoglobulin-like domain containing protein, partial [bacterium]
FERVWVYFSVDSASKANGRYGDGNYLILNAWFDWNGDGDFRDRFMCPDGEANEHIIWLRAEPAFVGVVNALPDSNFIVNPMGWGDSDYWYILYFRVPPDNVMTRDCLWSRFRLEYDSTTVAGWPATSFFFNGTELGPAFYGEVEDYCLKIDYGDAKDGPYPTLKSSNGARHFDGCKEWLGDTLSGEFDANDSLDSDGIKNLEPWDTDRFDDGIVFPLELKSDTCRMKKVKVTMSVLNKDYLWTIDPYTYRYGIVDGDTFCLIFNAWVDWTFDKTWDTQNTCVVPGDASDHLLWQSVSPHDSSVVCNFPTHNFRVNPRKWAGNSQTYELTFWMPAHDVDTLWARGRLEYTDWPNHQKVPGMFSGTYKGESYYGEVEDYLNTGPIQIRMSSFTAIGYEDYVEVEWTTGLEVDIAGFNLYRSEVEDGEYVRINEDLIPAQGSEVAGATYSYTDADVEMGKTYYYKLEAIDVAENSTWHGPISVTLGVTEVAEEPSVPVPDVFALVQNYPNPFNVETDIRYQIPGEGRGTRDEGRKATFVYLKIYNVLGQEVRTLVDEEKGPGYYSVHWDGKDNSGADVTSGIYFYRITAGKWTDTKKMVLLK